MKKAFLVVVLITLVSGCSLTDIWTGFYYPDKKDIGDSSKWQIQSGFRTLEDCRDWVIEVAGNNPTFDYECGLNCKLDKKSGLNICKKTVL